MQNHGILKNDHMRKVKAHGFEDDMEFPHTQWY